MRFIEDDRIERAESMDLFAMGLVLVLVARQHVCAAAFTDASALH